MGLRVVLDCDGVLAKTIEKVIELYNKEYSLEYGLERIKSWDLRDVQAEGTDMCKYFNKESFFRDLGVVEGAREYVEKLVQDGNSVYVATVSPLGAINDKFIWLRSNFPMIKEENIRFIVGNPRECEKLCRGGVLRSSNFVGSKSKVVGDILLDDAIHNIDNMGCRLGVLLDYPWNRGREDIMRVKSWGEFYRLVKRVERGGSPD